MRIKKKQIKTAVFFLAVIVTVVMAFLWITGRHTLTRYVEKLEAEGRKKQEIIVAVIDSGCNGLEEYEERITDGYDFLGKDEITEDAFGHGTQIASLILSNTPEEIKIMPLKVADAEGCADRKDVCAALSYAEQNGADIINLSLNAVMDGKEDIDRLNETVEEVIRKGVLVVISAGNMGEDVKYLSPAGVESALIVGATDHNRVPYFFSGYGDSVDVCSYGSYAGEQGTSFAAAYTTSVAAILQMYGEDAEKIMKRYGEKYTSDDSGKSYGKGYVWLEFFDTGRTEAETSDAGRFDLVAVSTRQEDDLGLNILDLEWKTLDGDRIWSYLINTPEEYVGLFLESLSEEEMSLLEGKCPLLHSEISVSRYRDADKNFAYEEEITKVYDFAEYCKEQYESNKGKMLTSDLWSVHDATAVFYISNEDRTVKYRCEITGNLFGKMPANNGGTVENILGGDNSLEITVEPAENGNSAEFTQPEPKGKSIGTPHVKVYATGISSRWVVYSGDNYYEVVENPGGNTINYGDNGLIFYGISIEFKNVTLTNRQGYHWGTNVVKAYKYGTNERAKSRTYAHLEHDGFVYDDNAETEHIGAVFAKLIGPLTATSYTARYEIGESVYTDCPRPHEVPDIAEEFYNVVPTENIYRLGNESSFDTVNGEMTMNTDIYHISSLSYYSPDGNRIVRENDTIEFVLAPEPNSHHITLDANWGEFTDYRTGRPVTVTGVTTTFDSTDYSNIAWATPTREGYVFKGWYVEPDDPDNSEGRDVARNGGVQVWGVDGKAKRGTYWTQDGENALWCYTGDDHPVFFAHWERDNTTNVCVDANWGHLFDYEDTHSHTMSWTNITSFTTRVGKNYFDNIRKLAPYRDGFTFQGWYVDPNDPDNSEGGQVGRNGGVQVWKTDGTANLENGNGFWDENGNWEYSGDSVVVFAHWKDNSMPETYTAYFDANGGSLYDYYWTNTWKDSFYCWTEVGKNYFDNVSRLDPTWTGHTFLGWYDHASAGTEVYNASGAVTNEGTYFSNNLWQKHGDGYFFAHWETNTYKVIYHSNNGTGREVVQDCVYGTGYDYLGKIFSMPGKTMSVWNTKADGTGESRTPGAAFGENLAEEDGAVIHLYAQWDTNTYNVRFDANGGTGSRPAMTGLSYGTTYTLSANTPPSNGFARTGYAFQGWNTKADGTGENIGDGGNIRDLSEVNGGTVTLYARWKDVAPPEIEIETGNPENASGRLVYGWTNRNIVLKFKATDNGSGMDSLTLYEGEGTGGTVLRSAKDTVEYTVSKEGVFYYTLVAKDMAGNTATLYITTKIDYGTPTGEMILSYDGQHLDVSIDNIVEENRTNPGNQASGCKEAWVILTGLDGDGNTLCEEQLPLVLQTPGNIYTGAAYSGGADLNDTFNYDSDFIQITAYVRDYAGNYLPPIESEVIPAFTLSGHVERCLGAAQSWRRGEAGKVYVSTGTFVDSLKIEYPAEWTALDETLKERIYDYGANMEPEKNEADLFYIPLYAEDGQYIIVVHAYKNGREKTVELPVRSSGSMLEEIRTRLR